MSDTPAEFREAVTIHLERLSPALTSVLRRLMSHPYPPEVHHLDFEVFCDGFTEGFPVRAFFMDETNCEHFVYINGKAQYPTNVDPGLLEIDGVYSRSFEKDFAARDPELDYMTEAGKTLVPWFATCWYAAGGPVFPRPAYIGLHDDSTRYDLASNRWV
jgi:hypothetical protein